MSGDRGSEGIGGCEGGAGMGGEVIRLRSGGQGTPSERRVCEWAAGRGG
jgi:hypothetical protein